MKKTIGPLLTMISYPSQCAQRSEDDTLYVQEFVSILRGEPEKPGESMVFREQASFAPRAAVQAAAPQASGRYVQPKQKRTASRRKRVLVIIAAVVLFACAAALSVLLLTGRNADTPEETLTPTPTAATNATDSPTQAGESSQGYPDSTPVLGGNTDKSGGSSAENAGEKQAYSLDPGD